MSYIVLVGGQLQNKGAQAMTFTLVDQIKKEHPNKNVVLFSSVFNKRDEKESEQLNFKVIHWPIRLKMKMLGTQSFKHVGIKNYLKFLIKGTGKTKEEQKEIINILENTDYIFDISGYALSSQRGYDASLSYIYNLMIAKRYNIPVTLFPQSFGPFNYSEKESKKIQPLIKSNLVYPEKIYVRELDGLKQLEIFGLKNTQHSMDSVLQGPKEFTLDNIFNNNFEKHSLMRLEVESSSVALIPNIKIMKHGNKEEIYNVYNNLINRILESGKKVYLIRHSFEDLEINKLIKSKFENDDRVELIEEDLSCIEIDHLISKFDFIIGSRYHAVIHAYKNSTPALVFGWAIKYQELMKAFDQEQYIFDVREDIEMDKVISTLDNLIINSNEESLRITNKMNVLERLELFKV